MRIWLDPDKLHAYSMAPRRCSRAGAQPECPVRLRRDRRAARAGGPAVHRDGERQKGVSLRPSSSRTSSCAPKPNGTTVRLKDVARVELGLSGYGFDVRLDDKPGGSVRRAAASRRQRARGGTQRQGQDGTSCSRASRRASSGSSPFDSTTFIKHAIKEVIITLVAGGGAGVHRDAGVPAELPRDPDPHAGRAGGAAWARFIGMYALGFSINQLSAVRHGARDRHRGGRCDRRDRGGRAASCARRACRRRKRRARRWARSPAPIITISVVLAAVFIPSAMQTRQRRGDLSAVRAHHRDLDAVLGVPGAELHARAVRHRSCRPAHLQAATSSSAGSTVPTSARRPPTRAAWTNRRITRRAG